MSEKRYAVLIGNGDFPQDRTSLPSLRCSINDAKAFDNVLRSPTYGLFDETVVLPNKPSHEILLELEKIFRRAEKNDLVLIYYSGHGKLNTAGTLHLASFDTKVDYIQSTSVSVVRIRELMDACPSNKMILILDCCYSGRVTGAYLKGTVDDHLQQIAGGNGSRGIYLLTASTGVQVAQEKEGDENSLLTKYLLEGIREAKADFNDDGYVTISDLFKYASETIRLESSQVPTKTDLNVQGDSLVVAKTGRGQGAQREAELVQLLYYRRQMRDRSIIAVLTIGAAVGGGAGVLIARLLVSLAFGPDRFLLTTLLLYSITATALSGAMSLGMAIGGQLWQTSGSSSWTKLARSRSNLSLLFGTLLFTAVYLFFAFVNNPNQTAHAGLTNALFGTIGGIGLGLSGFGLPTTSARLGVRDWLLRIALTGVIYSLVAAASAFGKTQILLNLTWGKDAFARALVQSTWFQNVTITTTMSQFLAIADAFIVGCALAAGTMFGLTKTANILAGWIKKLQFEK